LLVGPSDCPCEVEPLGVGSVGPELGVVDAGFFLGVRNPLKVSANCVNKFFLGDVILLEVVFGVALLPSTMTSPSVGPEFDRGETGARVGAGSEPDGVCGGAGSVVPALGGAGSVARALGGSVFISDSCGS